MSRFVAYPKQAATPPRVYCLPNLLLRKDGFDADFAQQKRRSANSLSRAERSSLVSEANDPLERART
jgi:hypothetical protein